MKRKLIKRNKAKLSSGIISRSGAIRSERPELKFSYRHGMWLPERKWLIDWMEQHKQEVEDEA